MDAPPLTPLAAALLAVPAPERALLIGSGDGEPALLLAREFPSARVRGVDRSPERIREALAKVGLDPEGRIAFKRARPASLPYPDDFFDLVAQVDDRVSPREAARVLCAGGHFVHATATASRLAPRMRRRLLVGGLTRQGFEVDLAQRAGSGNFLVARLDRSR